MLTFAQDISYDNYVIPKALCSFLQYGKNTRTRRSRSEADLRIPGPSLENPKSLVTQMTSDSSASSTQRNPISKHPITGERYDDFNFGFGRRICAGRDIALSMLCIDIAMLLRVFEFLPAQGEGVRRLSADEMQETGITLRPVPFEYELWPRNRDVAEFVVKYGKMSARLAISVRALSSYDGHSSLLTVCGLSQAPVRQAGTADI